MPSPSSCSTLHQHYCLCSTFEAFAQLFYLLRVTLCQVERPNEPVMNTANSSGSLPEGAKRSQMDWCAGALSQTIGLRPGAVCTEKQAHGLVWGVSDGNKTSQGGLSEAGRDGGV